MTITCTAPSRLRPAHQHRDERFQSLDGNSYSNPGYCSSQQCQKEGDDRACYTAGGWLTNGTLGRDAGCNLSVSPAAHKPVQHASRASRTTSEKSYGRRFRAWRFQSRGPTTRDDM